MSRIQTQATHLQVRPHHTTHITPHHTTPPQITTIWGFVASGTSKTSTSAHFRFKDYGIFRPTRGKLGPQLIFQNNKPLLLLSATFWPVAVEAINISLKMTKQTVDILRGELTWPKICMIQLPMKNYWHLPLIVFSFYVMSQENCSGFSGYWSQEKVQGSSHKVTKGYKANPVGKTKVQGRQILAPDVDIFPSTNNVSNNKMVPALVYSGSSWETPGRYSTIPNSTCVMIL
ncbi:hypothetical protein VP01_3779g2 [Puccinia sorghi]|uniref:Uncharacterized protein n=1 Tax=Puccinia sorghi TaxID=27349 RepID=A0A0L6UVK3_9BASI|nr:hypothetical protein VP01_3779g2 [Puccinia sorghi]